MRNGVETKACHRLPYIFLFPWPVVPADGEESGLYPTARLLSAAVIHRQRSEFLPVKTALIITYNWKYFCFCTNSSLIGKSINKTIIKTLFRQV